MADLPERMYAGDRLPDPDFEPEEALYHRCTIDGTERDESDESDESRLRLKPSFLRFSDFSVNRGKYSEPGDVLLPSWTDWGVARFNVGDVPTSLTAEQGGTVIHFRVEHMPEPENYAHSEVRSYRDDRRIEKSSRVPETVKSRFRQILSERTVVIIEPRT